MQRLKTVAQSIRSKDLAIKAAGRLLVTFSKDVPSGTTNYPQGSSCGLGRKTWNPHPTPLFAAFLVSLDFWRIPMKRPVNYRSSGIVELLIAP